MDRRSKILLFAVLAVAAISVGITFYGTMIQGDFVVIEEALK